MANDWLELERLRLSLDRERKTNMGKPSPGLSFDDYIKEQAKLEGQLKEEELYPDWNYDADWKEAISDMLGQLTWSFADEALLGAPGMATEYDWFGEDRFLESENVQELLELARERTGGVGPTTYAGKTGQAIGGVAGFIAGGPMKFVHGVGKMIKGGMWASGKLAGKTVTTEAMLKKGAKEAAKITAKDPTASFVASSIEGGIKSAVHIARRPGVLNDNKKFVEHVWKGIDDSADVFSKTGMIDKAKAKSIGDAYKKYFTDRPVESFMDLLQSRMLNKQAAFGIGSMIQEGIMFGTLDAAKEAIHTFGSGGEHEWDWSHPIWGAGVGAGFGVLKWFLPQAGSSADFSKDFKAGIKASLFKGRKALKGDNFHTLSGKSRWLGADAKVIGEEVVPSVKFGRGGKNYKFDLTKPESETIRILDDLGLKITDDAKANVLRKVLKEQTGAWGKRMMKWAGKSEWSSVRENWPRMVFGTAVMNMRTIWDTYQGQPIGTDDVILNVLVGAYLNRRGNPRRIDQFPEQMNRLRSGLNRIGVLPKKRNPFTTLPSIDNASRTSMNPFANDKKLNEIVKFAEERGVTTNNFEGIDNPVRGLAIEGDPFGGGRGRSSAMSGENLTLFNEFHRFLHGASTKKYVLNKDSITEKTAIDIQKKLEAEFGTLKNLRNHMEKVIDKSTGLFEGEIVDTASEIMLSLGYRAGRKGEGNIGELPFEIMFDNNLTELAAQNKLGEVIPSFEGVKNQSEVLSVIHSKVKNVFQTVHELSRASKRTKDQVEIIRDDNIGHEKIEKIMRIIEMRETSINAELGLDKTGSNSFDFNKVYDMTYYLKNRVINKQIERYSKILDIENVDVSEIQSRLIDSGIFRTGVPGVAELSLLREIGQINIVGSDGKPLKDSALISEHKMFLGSLLGVMNAKNQYKKYIGPEVDISVDQINSLKGFLNNKGLNVMDALTFQEFSIEATRRITYQNFAKSSLNAQQIGVFQAFYGLGTVDIGESFTLMKYSDFKGVKNGIEIGKIEYLGSDKMIKDVVVEYNDFVSQMKRDGKIEGTKDNVVSVLDKPYIITNEPTFKTIQSTLHDAIFRTNNSAKGELIDFLVSDIKQTKGRDASLTFLQSYPQYASKLIKLLFNEGALDMQRGTGENNHKFEYLVNNEKWSLPETQAKVLKFIERHGINLETVDMMSNNAKEQLKNYINEKYSIGDSRGAISIQTFFNKYLPNKSNLTPEKMNDFINNIVYDVKQNFRGADAIRELLAEMDYKVNDRKIASEHLMQIIGNRLESKNQKVFYYQDGEVKFKDTDLQSYKTPYFRLLDGMGIKYALVDGMSMSWSYDPISSKPRHTALDIFQEKSELLTTPERDLITSRKTEFMKLLNTKTDVEGFNGIELIEMPGMKLGLAVNKADFSRVNDAFYKLYDRHINNPDISTKAADKLENLKERLDKTINWNKSSESAFRLLLAESYSVGSNKNMFLKLLDMNEAQLNKYFVGRQTLFNTMKFKRINTELMDVQNSLLKSNQRVVNNYYRNKGNFGVAILNDKHSSWQLKEIFEQENGRGSWREYFGDRKNESSIDSISYISRQMAEFLGIHFGAPGAKIFKPVISSQGRNALLYGKTAFVYNPKYDAFFNRNPELDILMSKTAEKLDAYGPQELFTVSRNELLNNGGNYRVGDKLLQIPLDAVGVSKITDHFSLAKLPPSVVQNHTDIDLAQKIYKDYFSDDLASSINNVKKIISNPFMEHELIRTMKAGMTPGELQDINFTDGANQWTSLHLEWLNTSPYASIDVFGPGAKMNPIKSKFIDDILAPKSEYKASDGEVYRYGAKSTILQDGSNLMPTKFNLKTGKIDQYGEIKLPFDVGAESIEFRERDFKLKVIDKETNKVFDAKEIFLKESVFPEGLQAKEWDIVSRSERPLESLFIAFETPSLAKYDLAISTMRFPRTRPNDLALLRLRGFLDRRVGNGAVVNANDVYTIFEGDYDIDMVDYFWAGSEAWYQNIKRQQKVWVPSVNVDPKERTPSIELASKNPEIESTNWSILNGSKRSLAELRGVVQATSGNVKHLDNMAEVTPEGNKILIKNPNVKPGENGYWEVRIDWDNGDFHLRQALEGQLLLDMAAPDPSIVNKKRDWRFDFLFPKKKFSLSKDDFIDPDTGEYNTTNLRSFINSKDHRMSDVKDLKARVFRKWEMRNGVMEEIDLNTIDKDILTNMMSKYSEVMRVMPGRKVYTSGDPKKANYEQMLDAASRYFTHAKSFEYSMFNKLEYTKVRDELTRDESYKYQPQGIDGRLMYDYWAPKKPLYTDKQGNQRPNKFKSRYFTKSPIPRGVVDNMMDVYNGKSGSVVEKMLRKIYAEDPLSIAHQHLDLLTKDSFLKQEKLITELLHNEGASIKGLNDLMPAFLGSIKHDTGLIKRLKYQAYMLKKSRYFKGKNEKMNWLNTRIKELEQKLKPLLTKEYFKSKSARDIGRINLVEIESDANIIDGTVQYFTTAHMARSEYMNKGQLNYKSDLKMMRTFHAKHFGELSMQGFQNFGRKKLIDLELKETLSEFKTPSDIEMQGERLLTELVNKHGISFLWDYMGPGASSIENKIGVFKGNAMPIAVKPTSTYKRGISWLLKGKAGALPAQTYDSTPKEFFQKALENIAEIDFVWRRFFNAQDQHIPLDASEISKMITYGAPKWNWKMNQLFANYTDLKFNKNVDEFNPFGMGNRYNNNLLFFRSLSNLDAKNSGNFDQGSKVLSYTHQLIMENGYMSPSKHIGLMAHASEKIGPIMNQVFPSQIDINSGAVKPLKPFDIINNPVYVMLGGGYMNGPGLTMDPWRQMSRYETAKVNKMTNQVKDMKNVERDIFNDSYNTKDLREDILKKQEDC